ncbi:unnamed protein product [Cyprideis torosa]|uniref:Uncharacterized protein n=1 Tax=Cyprideis torosa TaxID=163714 RepID=A0A7R8WB82_9CRUS|nr:unnamed protein product [Cyprideis torosa]CAG0891971.1 unnamed protein product [Cyprideis torosa]
MNQWKSSFQSPASDSSPSAILYDKAFGQGVNGGRYNNGLNPHVGSASSSRHGIGPGVIGSLPMTSRAPGAPSSLGSNGSLSSGRSSVSNNGFGGSSTSPTFYPNGLHSPTSAFTETGSSKGGFSSLSSRARESGLGGSLPPTMSSRNVAFLSQEMGRSGATSSQLWDKLMATDPTAARALLRGQDPRDILASIASGDSGPSGADNFHPRGIFDGPRSMSFPEGDGRVAIGSRNSLGLGGSSGNNHLTQQMFDELSRLHQQEYGRRHPTSSAQMDALRDLMLARSQGQHLLSDRDMRGNVGSSSVFDARPGMFGGHDLPPPIKRTSPRGIVEGAFGNSMGGFGPHSPRGGGSTSPNEALQAALMLNSRDPQAALASVLNSGSFRDMVPPSQGLDRFGGGGGMGDIRDIPPPNRPFNIRDPLYHMQQNQHGVFGGMNRSISPPNPPSMSHPNGPPPPNDIFSQAGVFNAGGSSRPANANGYRNEGNATASGGAQPRETGIIEKLLHSYGFIQCCERQARLFFHFSQFEGNIEHLKIGDPVEFEMTYDRRTGKPIASTVSKISSEIMNQQVRGEERVTGMVTTAIDSGDHDSSSSVGRISYENRGECFFLPYGKQDVEGGVHLKPSDKVSFLITPDPRTGNLQARCVRLEDAAKPVRYSGKIRTLNRETGTGTIERGDVAKEIRFIMQDIPEAYRSVVKLGDDVEFSIQTRAVSPPLSEWGAVGGAPVPGSGSSAAKEAAVDIALLPPGSVIFEDIDPELNRGQVLKVPDAEAERQNNYGERASSPPNSSGSPVGPPMPFSSSNNTFGSISSVSSSSLGHSSATSQLVSFLSGRLRYRGKDRTEQELPFGVKDTKGGFTMKHGDWVQFNIATDRRNGQRRGTAITLLDDSFRASGEKREQGVIVALITSPASTPLNSAFLDGLNKSSSPSAQLEGGTIRCVEREVEMPFRMSEALDRTWTLTVGDEVDFHVAPDFLNPSRLTATRIKLLPRGTVQFDFVIQTNLQGSITKEADPSSATGDRVLEAGGTISYCLNGLIVGIPFYLQDVNDVDEPPRMKDKVSFNMCQVKLTKEYIAKDVAVIERNITLVPESHPSVQFTSKPQLSSSLLLSPKEDSLEAVKSPSESPVNTSPGSSQTVALPQGAQLGYIAAVKDGFGFIETLSHDREIFFHFRLVGGSRRTTYQGDNANIVVGTEVQYTINPKLNSNGKSSAETVKPVASGSIPPPEPETTEMKGVVIRPLRCLNPDQEEYCGLIQATLPEELEMAGEIPPIFEFGIRSFSNPRDILQNGDPVKFCRERGTCNVACMVSACHKKLRSTVDAIKGQYGFLSYEVEEGKKLFFHTSEVKNNVQLQPGDLVEFVLIVNQRTGKTAAHSIAKVTGDTQRPERLISRLRMTPESGHPRVVVIRQPRGPDGTRGFKNLPSDLLGNGSGESDSLI